MNAELDEDARDIVWDIITKVRDAAPRVANDADTDHIIDALLAAGIRFTIAPNPAQRGELDG